MRKITSDQASLRNKRWLRIEPKEGQISEENYFPLPFGHGLDLSQHKVFLENNKQVHAGGKSPEASLYPPFSEKTSLTHHELGEVPLHFWVVNQDMVKQQALSLIGRTHYLTAPLYGLILGCCFEDAQQENELKKLAEKDGLRPDRKEIESPVWTNPPGRMIGCAVLAELLFGIPKGRDHFADDVLGSDWRTDLLEAEQRRNEQDREPREDEPTRRRVVRKLGLTWASRFAVEKPFTGYGKFEEGIGTLLARVLKEVAKNHTLPTAERIEVIRTVTSSKAERILNGEREDFLTKADYEPLEANYSRPQWQPNFDTGQNTPPELISDSETYQKLYYCAELS